MWIGKHKYRELERKIEICMQENIRIKNEVNEKIYDMAKKILRQPDKLSKEIQEREELDKIIDEFIQSE
ncbi:MAG: hypothetical protein KH020_20100, partial [Clostridiales bacterium]|nr:hypothetical protein [Clostridiales bacterium]